MRERLYLSLLLAVLLCLVGWTAHAQLSRGGPARQTWEYKTVVQTRTHQEDWSSWLEDGKQLPLPVNGNAKRAELGSQGWELVAVATVEDSIGTAAGSSLPFTVNLIQYFKRPK